MVLEEGAAQRRNPESFTASKAAHVPGEMPGPRREQVLNRDSGEHTVGETLMFSVAIRERV